VRSDRGEIANVPAASADQIKAALDASPQLSALLEPAARDNIAREAALTEDLSRQTWRFWLTPQGGASSASMSWVSVRASRPQQQSQQLTIEWQAIHASVEYEQPHNAVQCESRGSRRYGGLAGPRDRNTWTEFVPRGLNDEEVARVTAYLQSAIQSQPHYVA
jgi:hypothetical protein